eukprot:3048470-Lingulodinium_polyedra.AAC.1
MSKVKNRRRDWTLPRSRNTSNKQSRRVVRKIVTSRKTSMKTKSEGRTGPFHGTVKPPTGNSGGWSGRCNQP